ncbi:hypothetical protein [Aciditerrimonas ferrireducens]|uniref:hypothetical protein n=1 Tax=Aciditerrimonas ferrireducens TaxID=667306 RepID=UPI002005D966|nr:hypothetical protein [Aciditerrimonas ferrireducens]MCK4178122.1 hypothetical protein [Aciditerrimonas ferrireducens]
MAIGTVYEVSRGELDVALLLVLLVTVLAAVAVYRSSERFRWTHGTTPWRVPSWLWVVLVILFFPWTLILYLLARLTTRPRQPQGPPFGGPPGPPGPYGPPSQPGGWSAGGPGGPWPGPGGWAGPQPGAPGGGGWVPSPGGEPWRPPRPAGPPVDQGHPGDGQQAPPWTTTPAGGDQPAAPFPSPAGSGAGQHLPPPPSPAPGWYVDPTDRYFLRYWDGSRWTERVASGGKESVDPLERT